MFKRKRATQHAATLSDGQVLGILNHLTSGERIPAVWSMDPTRTEARIALPDEVRRGTLLRILKLLDIHADAQPIACGAGAFMPGISIGRNHFAGLPPDASSASAKLREELARGNRVTCSPQPAK